jgi:hypothetical protein
MAGTSNARRWRFTASWATTTRRSPVKRSARSSEGQERELHAARDQATDTEDHLEVHHSAGRQPLLDPPAGVLAVVGTVGIVVAFARVKTYWRMHALYTFSLVLLLAAPNQVGYEAEERGVQILAGIGLLVVGLFILHAVGRWLEDHHPQPELVEPAA